MNFINRAIKNITRLKTKSILLMLVFFLIGNLVIVGLGVSYAAENAKKLTRMKMRPVVTYEVDYEEYQKYIYSVQDDPEKLEEAYQNWPRRTRAGFVKLLDNEHIAAINTLYKVQVHAKGFDFIKPENYQDPDYPGPILYDKMTADAKEIPDEEEEPWRYEEPNVQLIANSYDNMIEFVDGTYELVEGRFYSKEDLEKRNKVCLITKELADANNLSVGKSISVELFRNDYYWEEELRFNSEAEMEIIGIYVNHANYGEQYDWMKQMPAYMLENQILIPGTFLEEIAQERIDRQWEYYKNMWPDEEYYQNEDNKEKLEDSISNFVILLDDPLYVEDFVEESKDKLEPYTMLNANNEQFDRFAKPLDTMSLFARIIVWIVVINAVVIISLVSALTMKSREKEMGILLSMGVEKIKIIGQLFLELAIVAVIGFSLSIISGSLSAKRIGQAVLDYQMSTREESIEDYYHYTNPESYFTDITQEEMLSEYEVKISPLIIAEIYGLGLGVTLISTMIPAFMIMRFNPKKILTDTY